MKRVFVDTSAWYVLVDRNDPDHRDVAHTFGVKIRERMMCQVTRITPADEEATWEIYEGYRDKSFSFTDCTSFAIMSRMKIETAIAIDSDFKAYGLHCLP